MSAETAYATWLKHKDELIKLNETSLNEATTRFQMIDTLFVEILGWPKS